LLHLNYYHLVVYWIHIWIDTIVDITLTAIKVTKSFQFSLQHIRRNALVSVHQPAPSVTSLCWEQMKQIHSIPY